VSALGVACGTSASKDAATTGPSAGPTAAGGASSAAAGASSNTDGQPPSSQSSSSSSSSSQSSSSTASSTTAKTDAKTTSTDKTSSTTKATPGAPAPFYVSGPSSATTVALTFHTNGNLGQVKAVLDIVEKRNAVLTAFIVGNWLDANPSMGKRLLDGHHEFANHTYTHPTFEQLSPANMLSEITKCRDAIAKVSGSGGRFFRLSGADDGTLKPSNAALVAAATAGYAGVAGFDVDPHDYQDPGTSAVIDRALASVKGGSIISLHMGHAGTIDAIGPILDGLASKNLQPVTLSTLLG